jgi:hypothetical protein
MIVQQRPRPHVGPSRWPPSPVREQLHGSTEQDQRLPEDLAPAGDAERRQETASTGLSPMMARAVRIQARTVYSLASVNRGSGSEPTPPVARDPLVGGPMTTERRSRLRAAVGCPAAEHCPASIGDRFQPRGWLPSSEVTGPTESPNPDGVRSMKSPVPWVKSASMSCT